jgi:hypothetical protein
MAQSLKPLLHLLETLRAKSQVSELLAKHELSHSGTWTQIKKHIVSAVADGQISVDELLALVERIEEHGDQYAFFYDVDLAKGNKLKSLNNLQAKLTELGSAGVLKSTTVVGTPSSTPVFGSVRHVTGKYGKIKVKLKWIHKRNFRKQIGETTSGNIVTVKYEIFDVRAVDIAEFDFQRNRAHLFVQKVGTSTREHRNPLQAMLDRLSPTFLDADVLQPLDLGPVLKKLNDENFTEARRRRCQARDEAGNIIDVTSATEEDDIFGPGFYKSGRDHYSGHLTSLHANAYWTPILGKLEREIHLIFPYRNFANAVVLPQRCLPAEREYVLSRVESIARGES